MGVPDKKGEGAQQKRQNNYKQAGISIYLEVESNSLDSHQINNNKMKFDWPQVLISFKENSSTGR